MRGAWRSGWRIGCLGLLGIAGVMREGRAQAPAGVVQLSRELRAEDRTGEISEIDLDRVEVSIQEAPPLGDIKERHVRRVRRRDGQAPGAIDRQC